MAAIYGNIAAAMAGLTAKCIGLGGAMTAGGVCMKGATIVAVANPLALPLAFGLGAVCLVGFVAATWNN